MTSIFIGMAILSVLLTLNTAFLHAYKAPPQPLPENFDVFNYSIVGYLCGFLLEFEKNRY